MGRFFYWRAKMKSTMADFDPNAGGLPQRDETIGAQSMPSHLPPSNLEVKIRTMATDIESVRRGGGLLGLSEKITLSMPQEGVAAGSNVPIGPATEPKKKTGTYVILGIIGVAVLFAVGYFLPLLIASQKGVVVTPPASPPAGGPSSTNPSSSGGPGAGGTNYVTHVSFFKTLADATILVALVSNTSVPPKDQWLNALRFANATLTEVTLNNTANATPGWLEFLSTLGIQTANQDFFAANFENDFTAFVYKDQVGFWPGFVLKLKAGSSPLFLRADVTKLETDNGLIYSFFPQPPGSPLGFDDAQLGGQPVREAVFSNKPAAFIYGWFANQYLVIGTSEDAVTTAISHL